MIDSLKQLQRHLVFEMVMRNAMIHFYSGLVFASLLIIIFGFKTGFFSFLGFAGLSYLYNKYIFDKNKSNFKQAARHLDQELDGQDMYITILEYPDESQNLMLELLHLRGRDLAEHKLKKDFETEQKQLIRSSVRKAVGILIALFFLYLIFDFFGKVSAPEDTARVSNQKMKSPEKSVGAQNQNSASNASENKSYDNKDAGQQSGEGGSKGNKPGGGKGKDQQTDVRKGEGLQPGDAKVAKKKPINSVEEEKQAGKGACRDPKFGVNTGRGKRAAIHEGAGENDLLASDRDPSENSDQKSDSSSDNKSDSSSDNKSEDSKLNPNEKLENKTQQSIKKRVDSEETLSANKLKSSTDKEQKNLKYDPKMFGNILGGNQFEDFDITDQRDIRNTNYKKRQDALHQTLNNPNLPRSYKAMLKRIYSVTK